MTKYHLSDVAVACSETFKGDKKGVPIVGLEHLIPEEVTLNNWDVDVENTFTKAFRKGDVLFGRRRAYLKKAAQAPRDGICSGDITVIRPNPDLISPRLLPFIIQDDHLFDYAVGKSAGSLSPRVKWEHLGKYEFQLPSMEEQEKIADLLWSITRTLQAYKDLSFETTEMIKAHFIEMFWSEKYPFVEMRALLHQNIKTERITEPQNEKYVTVALYGKGVRERNIEKYDPKPFTGYRVKSGQFIYSRIDARNGAFGIIPADLNGAVVSKDFPTFDIDSDRITNEYLMFSVLEDNFIQQINKNSIGTTNRQRVSEDAFMSYEIKLPSIEEQLQFAEYKAQGDKTLHLLERTIVETQALRKKIVEENFVLT